MPIFPHLLEMAHGIGRLRSMMTMSHLDQARASPPKDLGQVKDDAEQEAIQAVIEEIRPEMVAEAVARMVVKEINITALTQQLIAYLATNEEFLTRVSQRTSTQLSQLQGRASRDVHLPTGRPTPDVTSGGPRIGRESLRRRAEGEGQAVDGTARVQQ